MEISYSNQNGEEIVIVDGALETRDGSLWAKIKWFWLRRTGLERVLLLLVFLLLLSLIVVIAVVVINNRQSYPASDGGMEICMDGACITAAAEMISSMDLLADPCVDFYQYACGNWLRNNPIPENEKGMTILDKAANDVLASCNKFLKEERTINDTNDVLWKTKTFFKSCVNEDVIEKDGAGPLLNFLDEFGGINTEETPDAENENTTKEDITATFCTLYLANDEPIFAKIILTNQHILIGNPYYSTPFSQSEMEKEREFIVETLPYLYPNGSPEVIRQMAVQFTDIHQTLVNCSSCGETGNLTTLQTLVPKIDWGRVIRCLVSENFQSYPARLLSVGYFRVLGNLLDNTSTLLIKQYMLWRVLRSLLPHAGGEIGNISRKYQSQAMTSNQDRDDFCTNMSIQYLEDAIAGLFIERNINLEDIQLHRSLFEEIKDSFKGLVELSDKIDSNSRKTILQKIDQIVVEVAHPEYMSDHRLLNDAFKSVQIGDQYLTNIIAVRTYSNLFKFSGELSAHTGIIKKSSTAAFALYTVIIPLLTLLRPSLSVAKMRSLMYSGLGNTIGHELSHSLDENHSAKWADLTEEGKEVFKDNMECLLTSLESNMKTEYGDKILNFRTLFNEFWSDVSGLQISYKAFKTSPTERFTLPYLNITSDQTFYLNFAQKMCGHYREEHYLSRGLKYPPPKYRVLATLRNSYSFSAVFDCPRGSPMNPPMEKCDIWHQVLTQN